MARVAVSGAARLRLDEGWEVAEVQAGGASSPAELSALDPKWTSAVVPGTAASALRAAGAWKHGDNRDFDANDWWFRCRFAAKPVPGTRLSFEGLATLADVWLNGERILADARSMHVAHHVDVTLAAENELLVRFSSLAKALEARRPRPRWKTRLIANQQLRWFRTTMLGRMPGWSARPAPVGPFRPVWLEIPGAITVRDADVRVSLEGDTGNVQVRLALEGEGIRAARLVVGEHESQLEIDATGVHGSVSIADPPRWWPHTHGAQPRLPCRVLLDTASGEVELDLGLVGFRTLTIDRGDGEDFRVVVNGVRVFCRGVCWTPLDSVAFASTPDAYRRSLVQLRDAGMNIIRVGGTMTYEADELHALCDELGILVWQDLMFANMDYPTGDAQFVELSRREASELAARLQTSPSLAVVCGGSEVEQQIAMLGMPRDAWIGPLFAEILPAAFAERRPDVPYVTSSPTGGALPFRPGAGVAHYYGVGAYLRPLEDARRANVRFATESLAFANVPERPIIDRLLAGGESPAHHPRWKERVPRDHGAGWDFEDVRDHYVRELFGVDPMRLRYADSERWMALGRVAVGELMNGVFSEWRRPASSCSGGIIWFHQDLAPGAGFGIVDSEGTPKSPYWYLRRVLGSVALLATDEGTNGLHLHVVNEHDQKLEAELSVRLYRHGDVLVREAKVPFAVEPRGSKTVDSEEVLGGFVDATWAFRFGPPTHDLVVASLAKPGEAPLAQAFHFPIGFPRDAEPDVGLEAAATLREDGAYELTVRSRRFAYAVAIDAPGYLPDDNYFHLEPSNEKRLTLRPNAGARALSGTVAATNSLAQARITITPGSAR